MTALFDFLDFFLTFSKENCGNFGTSFSSTASTADPTGSDLKIKAPTLLSLGVAFIIQLWEPNHHKETGKESGLEADQEESGPEAVEAGKESGLEAVPRAFARQEPPMAVTY